MVAETNRAPFDLPEAENEIIAGYHTEFSSMKFAVFFMGEYAVMFIFGGVFGTIFLGGHNILPIRWDMFAEQTAGYGAIHFIRDANYWLAPLTFLGKCVAGMTFYIWLRATLPRLRYDQLMGLGWKFLLPAAVANFIVVAIWIISQRVWGAPGAIAASVVAVAIAGLLYAQVRKMMNANRTSMEKRTVELVDPSPAPRTVELV
jgi:NADH-quinone oxidoreductase subunit H